MTVERLENFLLKNPYRFFRHLRNVSLEGDANKPNIEFTADGDLKSTELKIMNLRPSVNSKNIVWEEVYIKDVASFLTNLLNDTHRFRLVCGNRGLPKS